MPSQSNKKTGVQPTALDRLLLWASPDAGLRRLEGRARLQALEATGYITPGASRRSMRGWNPTTKTADQDTLPKAQAARAGSRDLAMNSGIARAALKRETTNVVGWGLNLQSRIDREFLGLDDERADGWEKNAEREFRLWASSQECDAARTLNFYEIQAQVVFNASLSGDVFVMLPYISRGASPYSLRLKVIEADWVVNPAAQAETQKTAGGVEVDSNGAPVAYHMRKPSPEDLIASTIYSTAYTTERIPVYGASSGRRQILHLFQQERPGQRRGMPMLSPVVEILKQITRLSESELMASVVASFFTVFVKTQPAQGGLTDGFVPGDKVADTTTNASDDLAYEMGSGNVIELGGEGQDISIADPKRPNGNFEPFFLAMIKQIGAAIEIPYEQLLLTFNSSYSAARGAMLEAWKFYRHRRIWLSRKFCQPVYEEFLAEAVALGRIEAPGFFEDPAIRAAWAGSFWSGPGQGQIDPYRETQAADLKIQRTLSTYETEYAAIHGDDWASGLRRNAREVAMIKKAGIAIPQPQSVFQTAAPTTGDPENPEDAPAPGTDPAVPAPETDPEE